MGVTMSDLPKWLEGAHYKFDRRAELPYLDVIMPNSATVKNQRFRGKAQCDVVQCLLDALGIPGEVQA